jgi:holin-like protein
MNAGRQAGGQPANIEVDGASLIRDLLAILGCQLAGELVHAATGVPLSGPVIGMALLFGGLLIRGSVPSGLQELSNGILSHLSLLFVPAAVGIMLHLALLREEWLAIAAALLGSTVLTVIVTAAVMRVLCRLQEHYVCRHSPAEDALATPPEAVR